MMKIASLVILLVQDFRSHALPTGCQSNEWQCTDGSCISLSDRCDNFPDCTDGSDELQCTITPVCLEGLESCPQPNGTTVCVKKAVGCNCGPVKVIANGKIDSDNITIGSVATVTCDAGYDATLPTVTCQVTGLWETVSCIPKDCGSIPSISFGNIILHDDKNSTLGATAEVTCDSGYQENKQFIVCQSSGVWENASCLPLGCGVVPAIAHGTIKTPANDSVGSFASVVCDEGYEANVSSVFCQISGQWESASCTIKDCGQTPAIPFGQITPNDITTYGSSADVTCYTGYTSNVSKVHCQSSGLWEESICKPVDCGFVPSLSFGNITLSDNKNSTFGARAEVTCDSGYLENKQIIVCQSSGVWENAACLPIDCGIAPFIKYGNTSLRNGNRTTFGAIALVSCQENYVATTSSIKCQSSGLWESVACVFKGCGSLPRISHGTIRTAANVSVGSRAYVVCDTGYESNVSSVTCRSSGYWDTALCLVKDCGSPPAIAFGNISLNSDRNTTFGAMAYVTCDYNFATSTPVITCQSTGKWENAFCLHKGCKFLSVINNGAITADGNATVGSYATVTCGKGYEPSTPKVMCTMSGAWGTASCKLKDCGPTPLIANGNITLVFSNKSTYREEAFVICDANYSANVSRISCQSTGVWEAASCISESKLSYDACTKEHGTCTQYFYENVRLRGLKSTKCKTFCQCAHASTLPTGNVTYKWVEHKCPPGTLFDDSLPSPVCNHAFFVLC